MIEQGVTALITADPTLTGLIGNRCYPVLLPQGAPYPALVYQVVSGTTEYAFDSAAEVSKRIQFDAWSDTYAAVKAVQSALHNLLAARSGRLPDGCYLLGSFRGVELDEYEQQLQAYRSLADYTFHYIEG